MEEFSINIVAQLVEQWTGNQRVTGSSITAGGVTMLHPFFLVILAQILIITPGSVNLEF